MKPIITYLLLVLGIANGFACSCLQTNAPLHEKVSRAFSEADIVLKGTVVAIKTTEQAPTLSSSAPVIYTFKIITSFKGQLQTKTVDIVSAANSASCGYRFTMGASYLVYAKKAATFASETQHATDYVTGLCDRNQHLDGLPKDELKLLKKLKCKLKRTL
jgi:hypothetical protein